MILQPGPADNGEIPQDVIAYLFDWVEINFNQDAPTCNISKAIVEVANFQGMGFDEFPAFDHLSVAEYRQRVMNSRVLRRAPLRRD